MVTEAKTNPKLVVNLIVSLRDKVENQRAEVARQQEILAELNTELKNAQFMRNEMVVTDSATMTIMQLARRYSVSHTWVEKILREK